MPDSHPLVCRFGALGDMILITPLLKLLFLRGGLPCDIVTIGAWNKSLFEQMPYVRNIFCIDSRSMPYWLSHSQRELIKILKTHQHQYVWVCETNARSYRLLARAGITRSNSANQLDLADVQGEHYCEKWLRLGNLSPPGFDYPQRTTEQPDTDLFVDEAEVRECRQWLQSRGLDPEAPLICVQAGSKRTTRRGRVNRSSNTKYWHEGNWAAVIDGVIENLADAQVLLCGVRTEIEMCEAIRNRLRSSASVQTVADDLPLRRLLALLSISHSCISVDTGPAHAAAALNCPLVVLFGKANPARFRPISRDSEVRVIVGRTEDSPDAEPDIEKITPNQVLHEWLDIFQADI